jgi:disulfide bond formation protein DsbB
MRRTRDQQTFLKWALVNVLFLLALGVGLVSYAGKVEIAGKLAGAVVILIYVLASGYVGRAIWQRSKSEFLIRNPLKLKPLSLAIELTPMVAMLGTVAGFLIAFGSSVGDVQTRVIGASTGLASTFIGIACTVVLMVIRHIAED